MGDQFSIDNSKLCGNHQHHLCHADQVCCEGRGGCKRVQNHWQHHHRHSGEGDIYISYILILKLNSRCLTGASSSGSLIWARSPCLSSMRPMWWLPHRFLFSSLKRHSLLNFQGHQDQSIRIHKNLGPYCQMLLFSATYDQVAFLTPLKWCLLGDFKGPPNRPRMTLPPCPPKA